MEQKALCDTVDCLRVQIRRGLCSRCYLSALRTGAIDRLKRQPIKDQSIVEITDGIAGIDLGGGIWALLAVDDIPSAKWYTWRLCNSNRRPSVRATGRRHISVYLHRLLTDAAPTDRVVHLNRDRLDNRRSNLQVIPLAKRKRHRLNGTIIDTRQTQGELDGSSYAVCSRSV